MYVCMQVGGYVGKWVGPWVGMCVCICPKAKLDPDACPIEEMLGFRGSGAQDVEGLVQSFGFRVYGFRGLGFRASGFEGLKFLRSLEFRAVVGFVEFESFGVQDG